MNDEINLNDNLAEEWELSLSDALTDETPPKAGSTVQNQTEDRTMPPADFSQPKEEKTEDWGMTNPLTPPPATDATGWKLSEPVFRSSEGSTPNLSPKTVAPPVKTDAPVKSQMDFATVPAPELPPISPNVSSNPPETPVELKQQIEPQIPAAAAMIEPQPDVIEELTAAPVNAAPPAAVKPKSKAGRIIGVTAGLLAMLIFIIGFLILVYYFFLHKPPGE